jgi:mannose-6-phosphate isomerase-like protein (cupin superfamily)
MKTALSSTVCVLPLMGSLVAAPASQPSASRSFEFMGKMKMTILLAGSDTGGSSALLDVRVPPNTGPIPHIHAREDEIYVIKQGTFQFFMNGTCIQAGPGATVYMPKGHMHVWKNISKHTGEQLMFVYPAGLERFFREVHDLGLKMPQDFDKMNELSNRKYGVNYIQSYDFHAGTCKVIAAAED